MPIKLAEVPKISISCSIATSQVIRPLVGIVSKASHYCLVMVELREKQLGAQDATSSLEKPRSTKFAIIVLIDPVSFNNLASSFSCSISTSDHGRLAQLVRAWC